MKTPWNRNPPWQAIALVHAPPDVSINALMAGLRAQIRERLLSRHGRELSARWVDHALLEAEALAFQNPFPILVFPELAEEKTAAIVRWLHHQQSVRERSVISFAA